MVEAVTTKPFTWVEKTEFEDVFTNLVLGRSPFNFLFLIENKRQFMEASVGRRLGIGEALLEVVRLVKRILTILSNILMMSDESYNHHLALTDQMMFNVKNLLVYLLFNSMTIIPNICFLVDFYDVRPFQKTFNGREESCKGGHCHKQGKPSYF